MKHLDTFLVTHPDISREWHPIKNGKLGPQDVSAGSKKKVWWRCPVSPDHEWESIVYTRHNGCGCPCCRNLKLVESNSLAILCPELAEQWNQVKNGKLTPRDVTSGSSEKVWWKCQYGHEWQAVIIHRHRGNGCPYCSGRKTTNLTCLATVRPDIALQWHPTKNGYLTPKDVSSNSNKKVWWKCSVNIDHEWRATVNDRSNNHGCPCCSGRKAVKSNSLATTHPKLVEEWHPTKNGKLNPDMIRFGSKKKIWWKCSVADDHEWEDSVSHRTAAGRKCPCCSGKKVVLSNCLATKNPELAKQWYKTKNILTPYQVTVCSVKKIWWVCDKGHEWKATVSGRTNGNGCPICKMSRGEKKISQVLADLRIEYTRWYKFPSCKHINPLPFDFVIQYGKQKLAIEYNGSQHYIPTGFGSKNKNAATENFQNIVRNDEIKRVWCEKNNVPFLVIPYWEKKNIESIILGFLNKINDESLGDKIVGDWNEYLPDV